VSRQAALSEEREDRRLQRSAEASRATKQLKASLTFEEQYIFSGFCDNLPSVKTLIEQNDFNNAVTSETFAPLWQDVVDTIRSGREEIWAALIEF